MRKSAIFLPNQQNLFIWFNALVMLVGLVFFGWRPAMVVFAYVFETIVVGLIHVFKLWAVYRYGDAQKAVPVSKDPRQMNGFAIIPFFMVHYFFFIFVQSVFIFSLVGKAIPGLDSNSFNVFGNYAFLLSQPDMLLAFACIAVSNTLASIKDFFIPQRYHHYTSNQLFMQPYLRIFVQQLVSILSGFFILLTNGAMVVALLLIVLRLTLDLYLVAIRNNQQLKDRVLERLSRNKKQDGTEQNGMSKKDLETFLE